jgi:hypothetical protein
MDMLEKQPGEVKQTNMSSEQSPIVPQEASIGQVVVDTGRISTMENNANMIFEE